MKQTTKTGTPTGEKVFAGYLTAQQLCQQLGQMRGRKAICARTLQRWHSLRIGPPRVRIGRVIVYKVEDIRRWLDENATSNFRRSGRSRA